MAAPIVEQLSLLGRVSFRDRLEGGRVTRHKGLTCADLDLPQPTCADMLVNRNNLPIF